MRVIAYDSSLAEDGRAAAFDATELIAARAPHVSLLLRDLSGGGAERNTVRLANALQDRGIRVDLVVFEAIGPCLQDVSTGVRLINLGTSRAALSVLALRRYVRASNTPAVISALHHVNLSLLATKAVFGLRTKAIIGIRNTISEERVRAQGMKAKLIHKLVDLVYPYADAILAVSHGVAEDFAVTTGIDLGRVTTIYNPVVTPELARKARAQPDHNWFEDPTSSVLVAAGRLGPQKDFGMLVRALSRVREHVPARLVILGEGEERQRLQQLVDDLGLHEAVDLPGFVDNPYPYMAHADLFVLSSRFEGLPTVLIEALALGTNVVATDCKSGPHEILAGGAFGRLVPVGDEAAMAEAIRAELETPRPPAGEEAYGPFMVDNVVETYLRLVDTTSRNGHDRDS